MTLRGFLWRGVNFIILNFDVSASQMKKVGADLSFGHGVGKIRTVAQRCFTCFFSYCLYISVIIVSCTLFDALMLSLFFRKIFVLFCIL